MTGRFDWMDDALCAQVGGDQFFPASGDDGVTSAAKKVCARCTAKEPCLLFLAGFSAIHDSYGIAAGLSALGRRKVRRALLAAEQIGDAA